MFEKKYVGQTGRTIVEESKDILELSKGRKNTLINYHFNWTDHHGVQDFEIHVIDLINLESKSEKGKALRLKHESR